MPISFFRPLGVSPCGVSPLPFPSSTHWVQGHPLHKRLMLAQSIRLSMTLSEKGTEITRGKALPRIRLVGHGMFESFIMVHWVEVLGKASLGGGGKESKNANSPHQRGKVRQFNFRQLVPFFSHRLLPKAGLSDSNRCESRQSVRISRVSCQQEYALVANKKKSRY